MACLAPWRHFDGVAQRAISLRIKNLFEPRTCRTTWATGNYSTGSSIRVGSGSPSRTLRYFRALLARLELQPDTVLFLDDREANVASARAVGLHAEQFLVDAGPSQLERLLAGYELSVV